MVAFAGATRAETVNVPGMDHSPGSLDYDGTPVAI
jgi:hypothetical protein